MPWITHAGVGGVAFVSQAQFDLIYSGLGWTITTDPSSGLADVNSTPLRGAGAWQANTIYQAGEVVSTPNGGLLQATTDLTSGATFSTVGWTRLTPDVTATTVLVSQTRVPVTAYGVVGDGSTNDLTAWQAALNAGVPLRVPRGCMSKISGGALTIPTSGCDILWESGSGITQYTNNGIFNQAGSAGTQYAIDSGATIGSVAIVSSAIYAAAPVAVGDVLLVTSEDADTDGCKRGFLRIVTAIPASSGDFIQIDKPLPIALTTTPQVCKVTLAGQVKMSGPGKLAHATPSTQTDTSNGGIYLKFSTTPMFQGIDVGNLGTALITVVSCMGGYAEGVTLHDALDALGSSHAGYGINISGATRGFVVRSGTATRVRHGATTTGGAANYGEPEACIISRSYVVTNTTNTGLDTHQQGYDNVIDGTVIGCPWGINDRAKNTIVAGLVVGCGQQNGTTATTSGGQQGVGVNLASTSLNATVLTRITGMVTNHYGALRIGGTGAKIAPWIDAPPDGNAIVATTAYIVIGGYIQGTRSGAATFETQALGGGSDNNVSVGTNLLLLNGAAGIGAAVRFTHAGLAAWDVAKSTDGAFLNFTAYNSGGTSALGIPMQFGRSSLQYFAAFNNFMRLAKCTTAARPAAATAGQGATVYDTTLSKPIFSDGTTWRDAAGTSV